MIMVVIMGTEFSYLSFQRLIDYFYLQNFGI